VHLVSPTTAASCARIDNTATVTTANDGSAEADAAVLVNCGAIALTKTADAATVSPGAPVGFVITATNTGAGEARAVTVTDRLPTTAGLSWTEAPDVQECAIAGGVLTCAFGTLGPRASRSVHISSPTTVASCARIDNTAAAATSNSGTATASASTQCVVTLPSGAVLPVTDVRPIPGSARLRGPSGCVTRPFTVVVRGSRIARVTFSLDGRRFKRVARGTQNRRRFPALIDPRGRSLGVHRVTAEVVFLKRSQTKPRALRLSFQRCKPVTRPRVTG